MRFILLLFLTLFPLSALAVEPIIGPATLQDADTLWIGSNEIRLFGWMEGGDEKRAEWKVERQRELTAAREKRQAKCDRIKDLLKLIKAVDGKPVNCIDKRSITSSSSCIRKYHWDVELNKHGSSYQEMIDRFIGKKNTRNDCKLKMEFMRKHGVEAYKDAEGWVDVEIEEAEERGRDEERNGDGY